MRYKTSHCGKFWGGGSAKDCTFTILETFEHISDNINLIINHDTPQGKIKVRNCSKFGEKIKVASKCKQRRQYCQNIGPWWYSSCFNAKWSPKQLKHSISVISHWFSVERVRKGPKLCKRKRVASRCNFFLRGIQICHMKADVLAIPKMWWFFIL